MKEPQPKDFQQRSRPGSQDFQFLLKDGPSLPLHIKYNFCGFNNLYAIHSTSLEDRKPSKSLMGELLKCMSFLCEVYYVTGNLDILNMSSYFTLCFSSWKFGRFVF